MSLLKDSILGMDDRVLKPVEVPEWKGTVHISEMSGAERDEYDELIASRIQNGKLNFVHLKAEVLIRFAISDEQRKRVFTLADLDSLESKNAEVLDRLFNEWRAINHLIAGPAAKNSEGPSAEPGTV